MFDYRLGYMLSLWILVPIMTNWMSLSDNMIAIIACLLSASSVGSYFLRESEMVQWWSSEGQWGAVEQ